MLNQVVENAALVLQQPVWGVELHDSSCVEHQDTVGVDDRVEAVGDSHHRAVGKAQTNRKEG